MNFITRMFRKTGSIKEFPRGREPQREEYGRDFGGIAECPRCHNAHFKKRWHVSLAELKMHLKANDIRAAKQQLCPACKMTANHLFEGELFTEGFPQEYKTELLNLIRNVGARATEMDPQHRIIGIEETKKGYRVTTTENQLADRLARKIKEAFHAAEIRFSHSPEPSEVDRIHVVFRGA